MAIPRVFVSSTCYDLQEIRLQLRSFIQTMGFDPVMSEFGDIFYDLSEHVQDSCRAEIARCNMFVLVVGNNYGSIYHRHQGIAEVPDSVTLQEFRKALEVGVPKFIFVNRFVQHDFENYRRSLEKKYAKYFAENNVPNDRIEETKRLLKRDFDQDYPFPQDAYRFVFHFFDTIYGLKSNNAVLAFESFEDIQDLLRKQWAGLVYDGLEKGKTLPIEVLETFTKKLDSIERQIRSLVDSRTEDPGTQPSSQKQATFDLQRLSRELAVEQLEEIQSKIDDLLTETLYDRSGRRRLVFRTTWSPEWTLSWLNSLDQLVNTFKWSKQISIQELFKISPGKFSYWPDRSGVPHKVILELSAIANTFSDEDKLALANSVNSRFNELFEKPEEPEEDDIPF